MTFAAVLFILGMLIAFGSFAFDAISIGIVAARFIRGNGDVPSNFVMKFIGGMLGMLLGGLIAGVGAVAGGWVFVQTYILPMLTPR